MQEFLGRIVIVLNGSVVAECKSLRETAQLGRKSVKGMSPLGLPVGWVDGTPQYSLDLEVYVPKVGAVNWHRITNAVIVVAPRDLLGKSLVFSGAFTTEVGASFSEADEATQSVKMEALLRVEV